MKHSLRAILLLLLFSTTIPFVNSVTAQTADKVTIHCKNRSLIEALRLVDQQSEYTILFNTEQVSQYKNITANFVNKSTLEIVATLLQQTNLDYRVREKNIIISPKAVSTVKNEKGTVTITVVDMTNRTPLIGALCGIEAYSLFALTNEQGVAVLKNVPVGDVEIEVTYVGFKSYLKSHVVTQSSEIRVPMVVENLKINDVVVVAKQSNFGKGTNYKVGRQAIDHIQAVSLNDILQLLPGSVMGKVDDMTSPQQAHLRTLFSDKNNANGVSITIDGVPMSNNAAMTENAYHIKGGGIDLRKISTDDIESVEVITGVPSAEYGDLSAGAIIINRKVGKTPLSIRGKVNPSILQASASKGWAIGGAGTSVNGSFDYLKSSGDPRNKAEAYDRMNSSLIFSKQFGQILATTTSVGFSSSIDKAKADPDAVQEGIFTDNKDYSLSFSHKGDLKLNRKFARNIRYNIGVNSSKTDYYTTRYVVNSGGQTALFTSKVDGIFEPIVVPPSYFTGGGSISKPLSVFAKVSNHFYVKKGITNQLFNIGVEYRMEKNSGIGKYNDNDLLPLHNTDTRPIPFNQNPNLNQLSAYFEDNLSVNISNMPIKLQAGVRFTSLQPGRDEFVWSISPRINLSFSPLAWLDVNLAYGRNSKTPGMSYLYPEPKYVDRIIGSYNTTDERFIRYQTHVIHVNNSLLKNSTTNRYEVALNFKLPADRTLALTGYRDVNNSGFGASGQYTYFDTNTYNVVRDGDNNLMLDMDHVVKTDRIWASTGEYSNSNSSLNTGIEANFELGRIKVLRTSLFLRGAYQQSESFSNIVSMNNPTGYVGDVATPPFKMVYPAKEVKDIARMFSTQLQAVCNIPIIELVASATLQVVWYNYTKSTNKREYPIGWLDHDLTYNKLTSEMLSDPEYRIKGILLKDQIREQKFSDASISKPIWLMNLRLTKNIAEFIQVSFYANNLPYYEPWQSNNLTTTKSQRNLGTFAFGLELKVTL